MTVCLTESFFFRAAGFIGGRNERKSGTSGWNKWNKSDLFHPDTVPKVEQLGLVPLLVPDLFHGAKPHKH